MAGADVLDRIDAKREQIDRHRPLPAVSIRSLQEDFVIRYAHHTTALGGNTLTLRETQVVIESGMVIAGKSLREHLEVVNVVHALRQADALAARARPLHEDDIQALHRVLMEKLVGHHLSGPLLMPDLEPAPGEHPVVHAARIHHRLVQIHPWTDGNGRTARMVATVLAMRTGYPAPLYEATARQTYLDALAEADLGRLGDFVAVTAHAIEVMEDRYLTLLD